MMAPFYVYYKLDRFFDHKKYGHTCHKLSLAGTSTFIIEFEEIKDYIVRSVFDLNNQYKITTSIEVRKAETIYNNLIQSYLGRVDTVFVNSLMDTDIIAVKSICLNKGVIVKPGCSLAIGNNLIGYMRNPEILVYGGKEYEM